MDPFRRLGYGSDDSFRPTDLRILNEFFLRFQSTIAVRAVDLQISIHSDCTGEYSSDLVCE